MSVYRTIGLLVLYVLYTYDCKNCRIVHIGHVKLMKSTVKDIYNSFSMHVQRRIISVVNFFVFLRLFFAFLLLYVIE